MHAMCATFIASTTASLSMHQCGTAQWIAFAQPSSDESIDRRSDEPDERTNQRDSQSQQTNKQADKQADNRSDQRISIRFIFQHSIFVHSHKYRSSIRLIRPIRFGNNSTTTQT
uniref:Uncharacterized protein n=1 Tax=Craspedostauros australis TaxID=1486917 RepID=A0A7R9ZM78_9STRA|mmetsp:Transcript_164/g.406  ORF Transcript_164/g.406 Transcript_164/m.406 type:complete len:114 (+) Transcript_164:137-478(+)